MSIDFSKEEILNFFALLGETFVSKSSNVTVFVREVLAAVRGI